MKTVVRILLIGLMAYCLSGCAALGAIKGLVGMGGSSVPNIEATAQIGKNNQKNGIKADLTGNGLICTRYAACLKGDRVIKLQRHKKHGFEHIRNRSRHRRFQCCLHLASPRVVGLIFL